MTIVEFIALFLCAFGASVFGSVVGLGGGFVMTPILRVFFFVAPVLASTASLFLVFFNTAAASFGFLKDKKVDFQLALFLAAGAIPGSIIGVLASHQVTIAQFDIIYGVLLIFLAVATMRRRGIASRPAGEPTFLHKPVFAVSAGIVMGIASSLFGVGGGIIVVPLMLIAARMPPHIAAATSSFVILLSAPVGIIALGGLAGGSFGQPIAKRISSPMLINLVIAAFIIGAIGLILKHVPFHH
jgi:uncharacterized membrane protein YfcA